MSTDAASVRVEFVAALTLGDAGMAELVGLDAVARGMTVAAVPVETIAAIVAKPTPEIVGLSVTMAGSAGQLRAALDEVLASGHAPRGILVGGRGVPAGLRTDDRVRYATDARDAMAIVESLADPAG